MSFPRYSRPFAFMHVMLLYRLFFQPLGGGKNPNPTRMGCRAEHTEIYYKQTGPLTAFFPFIYLKERKSMIKAITQLASQGTSQKRMEQFPHVTPTIRKLGRELGGSYPSLNRSPKNLCTHHRWLVSPTPREQLPPAATWCQQRILHPHTSKDPVNNEIYHSPVFFLQARTPEKLKKLA